MHPLPDIAAQVLMRMKVMWEQDDRIAFSSSQIFSGSIPKRQVLSQVQGTFDVPCTLTAPYLFGILVAMVSYSLYLHIPFCTHRCGYCDFNTYAGLESVIPEYVSALCAEIDCLALSAGQRLPAHTIFFGGGTPSLLPILEVERILAALHNAFDLQADLEITLEANPGTLTRSYLQDLHSLGVNRLSLGLQSAHPGELKLLERIHTYPEAIQSVAWARQVGFDNLNLDLIFGLPEQTLETWQNSLQLALGLHPEHFSLYALTIEHDTPFGRWSKRGLLTPPDPDLAADMYEWASEQLEKLSYAQYEISNWARSHPLPAPSSPAPSYACRHNLQYWRNLPYLGLGAGAHGYAAGFRTENLLSPLAYIQRFKDYPPCSGSAQPKRTELSNYRSPSRNHLLPLRPSPGPRPHSASIPSTSQPRSARR
jgi:oxygen-independent coproporphyrinogen-3 oxidase